MKNDFDAEVRAVAWRDDALYLLDQSQLPASCAYLKHENASDVVSSIKKLVVRGAPAIGIAGAFACVLAAREALAKKSESRAEFFLEKLHEIETSRPTAVNLKWAIQQFKDAAANEKFFNHEFVAKLLLLANSIQEEDILANQKMSELGSSLPIEGSVITLCNAGDLATGGGGGTALGVISALYKKKKVDQVYACETRPILQGLRLTAFELSRKKIPYTVICDSMAGIVMQKKNISAVIVGADRIAANGDTANKIGTYMLSVLAKHHQIPLVVVAPFSTFDFTLKTGESIPIEVRRGSEILSVLGELNPQYDIPVWNPAFDVTPHSLISYLVTENGIVEKPDTEKLKGFI